MSNIKHFFKNSIQARLSVAFAFLFLVAALVAAYISFSDTYNETRDLQDVLLKQTATFISPSSSPQKLSADDDLHIFIQTSLTPKEKQFVKINSTLKNGFNTISDDGNTYRVFVKSTKNGQVYILQDNDYREDLAANAAFNSAIPLLILIPLIGLFTILIMRAAMKPVRLLSESLALRKGHDLTSLSTENIPIEIQGFIRAINHLLEKTNSVIEQQKRFIADAAHELRSPMTALSLQADNLETMPLPDITKNKIVQLKLSILRNRNLLEQLLSLARVQSNNHNQKMTKLNSQEVFAQVIEDLLPLSEAKAQDVGVHLQAQYVFYADQTDIYTLIKTLVDNAIRYTPAQSRIDLYCTENESHVIFHVEDSGSGIAIDQRERVFEPFYRILGSNELGTGLGLSIANTIVQRYEGRIELKDSERFDSGLHVLAYIKKS